MRASRCAVGLIAILIFISPLVAMQWPSLSTSDVPKTADGRPNLEGPTPRTADGKPDLSGIWEFRGRAGGGRGVGGTFTIGNRGSNTNAPTTPEPQPAPAPPDPVGGPPLATFFNLGANVKDGLPYTPWATELHKQRESTHAMDNPDAHCLP